LDKFENNLDDNYIMSFIDNNINFKGFECCLVKKMYHIKGKLGFIENINNKEDFTLIFSSIEEQNGRKCNKNDNNRHDYNSHLCYGSVFPCLNKDIKRIILFPKDKILFIMKRIYYYRPSGIEIFTNKNKSYYFNFAENGGFGTIISYFVHKWKFKDINKLDTSILGLYNPKYFKVLSPLFDDSIDEWKEKNYYYSNFDKLMVINIFSNRSFNDLHQYPVFPML
jgi:hypothetical protein